MSRTTGSNWSRGYKTYRQGVAVGFVAALDRLEVKQVSTRYLSLDDRARIADLRQHGRSIRQIAMELGRSSSTVSRELRRPVTAAAGAPAGYRPLQAHRHAVRARARPRRRRADANPLLHALIAELLNQRWSPQQIARHLRSRFPDDPRMWLCHESIYQAVYQPGSALMRPSRLAPHRRSPLRTERDHRCPHQHLQRRRPRFEHPMATIGDGSFPPRDRTQAGHGEGDLIVGRGQASVIGTLVERQTRTVRLLHLPSRDSDALHAALVAQLADLPSGLLRSITWDQGSEMARHLSITASTGAQIYFCDSRSPWQRGSNENANGVHPTGVRANTWSVLELLALGSSAGCDPEHRWRGIILMSASMTDEQNLSDRNVIRLVHVAVTGRAARTGRDHYGSTYLRRQPFDQRMLIARAITRAARASDTIDSKTIISLAQTRTADTSVGLNARAVLNDRTR